MTRPRLGFRTRVARQVGLFAILGCARAAQAGEATLAEPIVEENITDVDASKVGTLEFDLTGASLASRSTMRPGTWSSEIEAEWRPWDRLGFGGGLASGGPTSGLSPTSAKTLTPRLAVSYVFIRDRPHQLFLQWEMSARYAAGDAASQGDPLEAALPYTFGVRWATEVGPLTLRAGLLGEAGGGFAHAPLRQSYGALLKCFDVPSRFYVGAELMEDWARASPVVVVPEAQFLARLLGEPIRAGFGVPATLGAKEQAEVGVAFRVVVEPDD
jgi:hypothetical protein